jgi:Rrf2 family protein
MMFSKSCEYGIRASIYIASNTIEGRRVSLREIAVNISSPEAFTAKILQQLVHHQIIRSVKGATGGFEIESQKLASTTLSQIVNVLDGNQLFDHCIMGLSACSESHPCPIHTGYREIRSDLKHMLEKTTLYDLSLGVESGLTFLHR